MALGPPLQRSRACHDLSPCSGSRFGYGLARAAGDRLRDIELSGSRGGPVLALAASITDTNSVSLVARRHGTANQLFLLDKLAIEALAGGFGRDARPGLKARLDLGEPLGRVPLVGRRCGAYARLHGLARRLAADLFVTLSPPVLARTSSPGRGRSRSYLCRTPMR